MPNTARGIGGMLLLALLAAAQTPAPRPKFEVVSFKPGLSPLESRSRGIAPRQPIQDPGHYEMSNVSMRVLLRAAFQLEDPQRVTAPAWIDRQFIDIVAKLPAGSRTDQIPDMLVALLEDRCKLQFHWDTKEETAYVLSVAPGGPKLVAAPPSDSYTPVPPNSSTRTLLVGGTTAAKGWIFFFRINGNYVMEAVRTTIAELIQHSPLPRELDAPLVDQTGLKGIYNLSLAVPGSQFLRQIDHTDQSGAQPSDPTGVDLAKSFAKLGLKLERRKVPMKQLVIDRLEKPTAEN